MNNQYYSVPENFQYNMNQVPIPFNRLEKKLSFENIINLNHGKKISVYQSFNNNSEWTNKTFSGILEQANNDYFIISDPKSGSWYFLFTKYIDYIKFDEDINTNFQFNSNM